MRMPDVARRYGQALYKYDHGDETITIGKNTFDYSLSPFHVFGPQSSSGSGLCVVCQDRVVLLSLAK